jgi:hypothetical protein
MGSVTVRVDQPGRSENERCPGMGRVENVEPGAIWSLVFCWSTEESPIQENSARNSLRSGGRRTLRGVALSRAARHPLRGGTRRRERRLDNRRSSDYSIA